MLSSSVLVLLGFTACSLAVPAPMLTVRASPKSPTICVEPRDTQSQYCGSLATVNSTNFSLFRAYDVHECAQRCFNRSPKCKSFGFQPSAKPKTFPACKVYKETLQSIGWQQSNSSSATYYDASCFTTKRYAAELVQDGGFSDSGSPIVDPWSGSGYYDTHIANSQKNGYSARLEAADVPKEPSIPNHDRISQVVNTCIGNTYVLGFDYNDYGSGIGAYLSIEANNVIIFQQNENSPIAEIGGQVYFTTSTSLTNISLTMNATPSKAYPDPHQIENIDDIEVTTIYRSQLGNRTVYQV